MPISDRLSLHDIDVQGKDVIIRVDFNVVSAVTGKVEDENRIVGAIPTIKLALDKGAKRIILLSHCGRPSGRRVVKYSLQPVVEPLERHLGQGVHFIEKTIGAEVVGKIKNAADGTVFLLENLRFHAEEEGLGVDDCGKKFKSTDEEVAQFRDALSQLGDVVVNDAFGTAHRAHSSMVGIDHPKVAGLLLKKELDYFSAVMDAPKQPFVAIMGGAKVGDKIPVINSMIEKVDDIIIGGGMAFTFLKVLHGTAIGSSLYDKEGGEMVPKIMEKAKAHGVTIHLPVDFRLGDSFSAKANYMESTLEEGIQEGWMGLDIGPKTEANFKHVIETAKTVIWNGPMGVFEFEKFASGSLTVLNSLVEATGKGTITVVGGGDSAALCAKFNKGSQMSHVSTGGGASLELLEGKELPGVAALSVH